MLYGFRSDLAQSIAMKAIILQFMFLLEMIGSLTHRED